MIKIFNKKIQRKANPYDISEYVFLTGNSMHNWDYFDKASEKVNFVLNNLEKYFNERKNEGFKTHVQVKHSFSEKIAIKENLIFDDSIYKNEFEKYSELLKHIKKINYFHPYRNFKSFGFPLGQTLGYDEEIYKGNISLEIKIQKDFGNFNEYCEEIFLVTSPYKGNLFKSNITNPKKIKASLCRRTVLPHKSFEQFFSEYKK